MFKLEQYPLKFKASDLAPLMSEDTINLHYGKHLATYLSNLTGLIQGTDYSGMKLEDIINKSSGKDIAVFNNSAQIFNHDFFFKCLAKENRGEFPNEIEKAFGSREKFMEDFKKASLSVFGSGWAWLVKDNGVLKIETTANADTPIAHGKKPIFTLDVWEHAYYTDYQNRRADFIDTVLNNLIDWNFVSSNL